MKLIVEMTCIIMINLTVETTCVNMLNLTVEMTRAIVMNMKSVYVYIMLKFNYLLFNYELNCKCKSLNIN